MRNTYVSLDLETTGLDPARDEIIEVGAVRFSGTEEIEAFSSFVDPGRPIPHFVTELTGISDRDVAGAPPARAVIRNLRDFVGRDTVIGHNVGFDLAFLRNHNALVGNSRIDTFELASILVPHASRYSLENLTHELGIATTAQTHRALDDARMTHALYNALFERALRLPQETLEELYRLGGFINWGPGFFFQSALRNRSREGFQGAIGVQLADRRGQDVFGPLFLPEVESDPLEPREKSVPIDVARLEDLLGENGPLAQVFEDYEFREEQVAMMRSAVLAFNQGHHLLVEAGTGTGKSLAYLLPALKWADQNDDRVVISTNTINLQEQLAGKDIPLLERLFPTGFRYMVLKGRSHYLCRRQFQALRRRGPSTQDEMCVLAKILLWLPNTLDGDGDGLFLPTPGERGVWSRLSASAENCSARDCPYYHGSGCFFYQARERAETVHLLVVNHALLLADIAAQNRVLPDYNHLIVDEAHHLERATTEALHFSVDWYSLRYLFEELLSGRGNFPGILDELQGVAQQLSRKVRTALADQVIRLQDAANQAMQHLERLFDVLTVFLDDHVQDGDNPYGVRLRLTPGSRMQPGWEAVAVTWDSVSIPFGTLVQGLQRLANALDDAQESAGPDLEAPLSRLLSTSLRLSEAHMQLAALIAQPSENAIYWLESSSRRNNTSASYADGVLALHSAPLHVGPLVQEHLFEKKRTVIMTSATLRVDDSFDYVRERLSAWDAEELAVGSPFDYRSAALLYVANNIPEPGRAGYQQRVSEALLNLFTATQGRAMALFTSYTQLRATADMIRGPLGGAGITVYAQGNGSSRAQLLQNFRRDARAVLLGTRSFWEGVDIPGEDLSCLVIAKLPFDVPNDPIVAARSEACDSAFNDYMVPEAVLRFLQGFGRLIRTRSDTGIVVVLDSRIVTKRYGQRFIQSLPGPTVRIGPVADLPEYARRWLAGKPLPVMSQSDDDPWGVPPPEEPPWWV
ncbi:MAG: DEAD/DEAH box helicase [Anaerolineae bacterium]|nr:DEAD/DEAH box helicase [Anaerolineae bacterium]